MSQKQQQPVVYVLSPTGADGATKSINYSQVTSQDLGRWFGQEYETDPRKLFGAVGILYRCIKLIADAVANMPRVIMDVEGHVLTAANTPTPMLDQDERPIPHDNELPFDIDLDDLLWRATASTQLLGASFWHKEKNRVRLKKVKWLDPATITPVYNDQSGLAKFERRINGRLQPIPIPVEDMVWVFLPGIQESGPGEAPGMVAARQAGILNNMDKFLEIFFKNGAMPTTIVLSSKVIQDPDKSRVKSYLERALRGMGNAFGIEVLSDTFRFEKLTPPLKEMVIPDITDDKQQQIAYTMGVPMSLIFSGAANYATAEKDDLHFYTKTVVPAALFIQAKINKRLFTPLGMRMQFRPDMLEIFQQLEAEKVTAYAQLFDRGVIDEDELRAAAGLHPRSLDRRPTIAPTDILDADKEREIAESAKRVASSNQARLKQTQLDDLARWQRKTLKAVKTGKTAASVAFESDALTAFDMALVRNGLRRANSVEEVKAAFAAPFRTVAHPDTAAPSPTS